MDGNELVLVIGVGSKPGPFLGGIESVGIGVFVKYRVLN
jgi:hypothetical protein